MSAYKVFKDRSLPAVDAAWLNDVSNLVYKLLGSNSPNYNPPQTVNDVLAALGLSGAGPINVQVTEGVATAGQTVITVPAYVQGINAITVYINGVKLSKAQGDYTESTPTSVTISNPMSSGDEFCVVSISANAIGTASAANITYQNSNVKDALDAINLPDYAALQAYTGSARSVYITGYLTSAAPSGIAGPFTRDDSDTTTASNGGTVIVDALGRRWKRQYSGPVNVQWFGAVGGGVVDDLAAIQAAINAGQSVYFPAEQYRITAPIKWQNQWLVGAVDNGQLSTARNQTMILPSGNFPAFVYFHPNGFNSQGGGIKNFNIYYSGTAPTTPNNAIGIQVPAAGSSGYPAYHTFENITVQGATWAISDNSGSWMGRWKNINSQNNFAGFQKIGGTTHVLESCYHRGGYDSFYFENVLGVTVLGGAGDLCSSAKTGHQPIYVANSQVSFIGCDFEANILTGDYTWNYLFTGDKTLVSFTSCAFLAPDIKATTTEQYLIKADNNAKVIFNTCDFSTPTFTGSGGLFSYSLALNNANIEFNSCLLPAVTGGAPSSAFSSLASSGSVSYKNSTASYPWGGNSRKIDQSLRGSAGTTFGLINNNTAASVNVTVSGAVLGDYAEAALSIAIPLGMVVSAKVTAVDTVNVALFNFTGSTQTIPAATINVKVVKE